MSERSRTASGRIALGAALGIAALWALFVAAIVTLDAPFGAKDSRSIATDFLGPRIARYLGFCPRELIAYFVASTFVRVPLLLTLAAFVRRAMESGSDRARGAALGTLAATALLWTVLTVAGAWVVGIASGYDDRAMRWSFEIGKVTCLAGLPTWTLAMSGALLIRRGRWFWLVTPMLSLICTVLSFGLQGEHLAAGLPGVIELGLLSGIEPWRERAVIGALLWPISAGLLVAALGSRRRFASSARATAQGTVAR